MERAIKVLETCIRGRQTAVDLFENKPNNGAINEYSYNKAKEEIGSLLEAVRSLKAVENPQPSSNKQVDAITCLNSSCGWNIKANGWCGLIRCCPGRNK